MWLTANKYKNLLLLLLWLAVTMLAWTSGYRTAQSRYQTQIVQLKQQYAQEKLIAEQQYSTQLSGSLQRYEAWVQKAQQINQQTASALSHINARAAAQQGKIDHVLQQDNPAAGDCFGTFGLQHYRQSLGYE